MTAVNLPHNLRLRPFTPEDYPSIVSVYNACFPDYTDTVASWIFHDNNRPEKIRWQRYVAEDTATGTIVATSSYKNNVDMFHPQKFELELFVQPERQGQGIGSALYEQLIAELAPLDPIRVRTYARDDHAQSCRFLTRRGYEEAMRDWESRLDPQAFDPAPFEHRLAEVAAQGIVIKSLASLASDPDRNQKLYEMDWTITLDMPSSDKLTKPSFEHFKSTVLGNPDILPEAWFVALDGDRYIGESVLWRSEGNPYLYVGATGVLREYRRRGIAFALKLHAVGYAKSAGAPEIRTWNAQQNRAMLSINEAMGFVKQPAWIEYAKTLQDSSKAAV